MLGKGEAEGGRFERRWLLEERGSKEVGFLTEGRGFLEGRGGGKAFF